MSGPTEPDISSCSTSTTSTAGPSGCEVFQVSKCLAIKHYFVYLKMNKRSVTIKFIVQNAIYD